MIFEIMGDERVPYIVFISMFLMLDFYLLRRVIKKKNKK